MAVGMLNGIFSPFFVITSQVMSTAIMPLSSGRTPGYRLLASLIAATATIMMPVFPPPLREDYRTTRDEHRLYAIWLTAAVVISLPALLRAAAQVV